jgi:hypothetical protein
MQKKIIFLLFLILFSAIPASATWKYTNYESRIIFDVTLNSGFVFNITTPYNNSDRIVNLSDERELNHSNNQSNLIWINASEFCVSYPCTFQVAKYIQNSGLNSSLSNGNNTFPYYAHDLNIIGNTYNNVSAQSFTKPYMLEWNITTTAYKDSVCIGFSVVGACFNSGVSWSSNAAATFERTYDNPGGYFVPDFGNVGIGTQRKYKLLWGSASSTITYNNSNIATLASSAGSPQNIKIHSQTDAAINDVLHYIYAYPPISATVTQYIIESIPINITSWGNNFTSNQNLTFSVPQNTIIDFNVSTDVPVTWYNWTNNGVVQNINFSNYTITASDLTGYSITATVYNLSRNSYGTKTWNVGVTPLSFTGGEGQLASDTVFVLGNGANITVLAPQNFTRIELLNSTQTPPNTLWFTINSSQIQFNTTSDKNISKISYINPYWNFTLNTINSTNLSVYAKMPAPSMNYSIYRDGVKAATNATNSTGWIRYSINGTGNYSIQKDLGKPYLISPTNQSTQTIVTLPYSQSFVWSNEGSAQYNIQVAQDSGFSIIISDMNVVTTSTSIGMWSIGQYFWRVRTYDGISTYGAWSEPFSFTLTGSGLPSSDNSTGIQGIVYETKPSGNIVLSNAIVSLQNLTHSFMTTTDINGYYLFKNLSNNSDYLIQATKKNYVDGAVLPIRTGNGTWVIQNLYLSACVSSFNCNINQQFVKFTVQTLFGTKYSYVEANVYLGTATTATYTELTDNTGAVNFWLIKDQSYRITFINSTLGINREITIFPTDTEYLIIISGTGSAWQKYTTQRKDAIYTNVTKAVINSTHAYINASYLDLLNETTALTIYINQTNAADPYNQTIIQQWSATAPMNNTNHSFVIPNYNGQQYIVHYLFSHGTYGTNAYLSVSFTKSIIPSGISSRILLWFAIIFMVMIGAVFTHSTAELGLIVVSVVGWIFLAFGFLKDLNTTQVEIGLTITTVLGVIAYFNMKSKREGYS